MSEKVNNNSNYRPIELDCFGAKKGEMTTDIKILLQGSDYYSLRTFTSYSFERTVMTPASAFRFTAPGISKETRMGIRSGDMVSLWAVDFYGNKLPLATGFIDETDTHIISNGKEYVITGRDTLGQLVDNDAIDSKNAKQHIEKATLETITKQLIKNTKIPQDLIKQDNLPNGTFLWQTNTQETKMNVLARYLHLADCLAWSAPDGRMIIGKPNFHQEKSGHLICSSSQNYLNNIIEARVRRSPHTAIRQIVTQLQSLEEVAPAPYTMQNEDDDVKAIAPALCGRSIYRHFSYGQREDAINQLKGLGSQDGNYSQIGRVYTLREIARDNMKVLDVEVVVKGHINENNGLYNIDQIYNVQIEDEDVNEDMYVYSCIYELSMGAGLITRMRLCRLGTICAQADMLKRKVQ